ncbi:ABC transporter permease [Bifidobacterium aquikefiricola]|uniref:ABC transporter permease n=1 Tax=Bifidobacterium aquikefiricola TaxID=3059038 RepID=A0AB39U8E3_9BIFI
MRFLLRRSALLLAALFGMSVLIFIALRVLPGDVASVMAGLNATPARVAALRQELGLNRSYLQQYVDWSGNVIHGNLGVSVLTGRDVGAQILSRVQITFPLILLGLFLACLFGIPLGCASILAPHAGVRQGLHMLALVGGALPALWGAMLFIMLFAKGSGLIKIFPSQGFPDEGWKQPVSACASLVLPALTVGIIVGASIMRYTRSALQEMLASEFVDMGMACGMTRVQAVLRIGLRIVSPQLVSVIGMTFAEMITGVMVIENLFALPGIGSMLVTDVGNRDLLTVQSELFVLAAFFLCIGFAVDVVHRILDPRLKGAALLASAEGMQ